LSIYNKECDHVETTVILDNVVKKKETYMARDVKERSRKKMWR